MTTPATKQRLPITATRVANTYWDLVCGVVLIGPADTLRSSPGYRVVLEVFRADWVCALLLLTVGALRLLVMVRPFTVRVRDKLAGGAAWLGLLIWGVFAVGIFIAAPISLGSYAYLGIAGLHAWSYISLVVLRWHDDHAQEAG